MSLDKATVASIANLARIKLPEERVEPMLKDQNAILGFVEQLAEVDTDAVEPLSSVTGHALPMRDDVVNDGAIQDKVTANAPDGADGFYTVPKVVE